MKRILVGIGLFFLFFYFLLFPSACLSVCMRVLALWSCSLVPSLLPVMILSRLLISTDLLFFILKPFAFFFRKLFGLSSAGTYALLIGYLCGYPMGVKTLSDLFNDKQISRNECQYLSGFINNVSPNFLISYICTQQLQRPSLIAPCFLILYGASLSYGLLTMPFIRHPSASSSSDLSDTSFSRRIRKNREPFSFFQILDHTIQESILQILKIGGYMMLFSLLASMFCSIPVNMDSAKAIGCSLLEITYGTNLLCTLTCKDFWKHLFLVAALSFGGLCSAFQSASFLHSFDYPVKKYIKRKAMIAVIALIYYLLYTHPVWMPYFF